MNIPRRTRSSDGYETEPEFGQDVFNLPLGSFAKDSPPGGEASSEDESRKQRGSPREQRYGGYASYAAYPTSPSRYHPGYYAAHRRSDYAGPDTRDPYRSHHESWRSSPSPVAESFAPPDSNVRASSQQRIEIEVGNVEDPNATPKKKRSQNPFRSPPSTMKKSPMSLQTSPTMGAYGSFGMMDTPGGTLADAFSPMGPSLIGFGEEALRSAERFEGRITLAHSESAEDISTPALKRRSPKEQSPFSGFISELSTPFSSGLQGVPRSPVRSDRRGRHSSYDDSEQERVHADIEGDSPGIPPAATPSESKPRKLWHAETSEGSGLRIELGQGIQTTQRTLEGINSMMRASKTWHGSYREPGYAPPYRHGPPPMPPITPYYPGRGPPTLKAPPSSRHPGESHYSAPVAEGPPTGFPPSSAGKQSPSPILGKENVRSSTPQRRQPCNCKKSKCLKLYCECFSADLFCEGCKCKDCNNLPMFSFVREKAIQDTKTKNPNAFKPRIAPTSSAEPTGHNMGCRCKRSECLKKYCEVRRSYHLLYHHLILGTPILTLYRPTLFSAFKRESFVVESANAMGV
jgi:hypothetical protein